MRTCGVADSCCSLYSDWWLFSSSVSTMPGSSVSVTMMTVGKTKVLKYRVALWSKGYEDLVVG